MRRLRRIKRPLPAITAAVFACSVAAADEFDIDQEVQAGIDAWQRGDLIGAMTHYQKAAEAGSPIAQAKLGWILDNSNDDTQAVQWYEASAAQSHAAGQFGLGEMYAKGEGVEKDVDKAIELYISAATGGHPQARRVLANAYENGALGREIDRAEALRWLQLAANDDDLASVRRLVSIYRDGGLGLDPDAGLADEWQMRLDTLSAE